MIDINKKDDNLIDFSKGSFSKKVNQTGYNFYHPTQQVPAFPFGMPAKPIHHFPGMGYAHQFPHHVIQNKPKQAVVRNSSVRKTSDDIFNLGNNFKTPKKADSKTEDFFKF